MSDQNPDQIELASLLIQHDKGYGNEKGTADLTAVVAAVKKHRRKGQVVVTIDVKPVGDDPDGPLAIAINVTPKPPVPIRAAKTWHADEKGVLYPTNPRQPGLFPVEVHDPRKETTE